MGGIGKKFLIIVCNAFFILSGCSGSDALVGSDADQIDTEEVVSEAEDNKTAEEILKEEISKTVTITQQIDKEYAGKN